MMLQEALSAVRLPWDMPYGLAIIGDYATITVDRNKMKVYPEWDGQAKKARAADYSFNEGQESHGDHVKNFIASIREDAKPACPPETRTGCNYPCTHPQYSCKNRENLFLCGMMQTTGSQTVRQPTN